MLRTVVFVNTAQHWVFYGFVSDNVQEDFAAVARHATENSQENIARVCVNASALKQLACVKLWKQLPWLIHEAISSH